MPLILPKGLPSGEFIYKDATSDQGESKECNKILKIVVLNLMPLKELTEADIIRQLYRSPLNIQVDFLKVNQPTKHCSPEHLEKYYHSFSEVRDSKYDGMIVTGAPLAFVDYEEVRYWDEIKEIFNWARKSVRSTFHICWGAQAALYYHYGIRRNYQPNREKIVGIYSHKLGDLRSPLLKGLDDTVMIPLSRYTGIEIEDVEKDPDLRVLAYSDKTGLALASNSSGSEIFALGHSEYNRYTLDTEYKRDIKKGLKSEIPFNYYKDDDPNKEIPLTWSMTGTIIFQNWINHYVNG